MRLTALSLTRYGNFESQRITFDPRPGALNLLLAPNGAGKSVLRAAFCDLLFGIGGQTPMGFRYGYPGMRIAAEAVGPDGSPFTFGRRKGQGNTLVDAEGTTLDPATITRLLGRTDRTLLERLFALDTERLREGQDELFASNGALADALESGAGGFHHARRLRKALEEARDSLAPTRRSASRPFYAALDRFTAARRSVSASLLRPDQWQKQQQALDAAIQRQTDQNRIADTASAEIARLERIRRVIPWLAEHDAAAVWLAAHPDAPVLDPGLAARLAETRSAIVLADHRLQQDRATAARLADQQQQIAVDAAVLAEAEEIDRLVDGAGAARKAAADRPNVTAQAEARRADVAALLRDLGSALPVDQAAAAIPPSTATRRARRLHANYAARLEAVRRAPAQVADRERERDAALAQRAALSAAGGLSGLDALVKEIRSDGNPAFRKRESEAALVAATEALGAALARVPGWAAGLEALVALAPYLPEAYERMFDDLAATRTEVARQLDLRHTARQARNEAQDRLTALTAGGPLPDEASLAHSRERRDTGWRLIFQRAFTTEPPEPAAEQAFAGPLPLPIAYERAVTAADRIADRRVQEAASVANAQAAQTALLDAETRVGGAETAYRIASERRDQTARVWSQVCAPLRQGDDPALREVLAFLTARDRVIDARQKHAAAEAAERALDASHADWVARLVALLDDGAATKTPPPLAGGGWGEGAPLGEPPAVRGYLPPPPPPNPLPQGEGESGLRAGLPSLLAAADKRLSDAQRAEKARAAADARVDSANKSLDQARAAQRDAETALAGWRADWAGALQALGRPPDEDPDVTDDMLQVYAALEQAQKEAASLTERVAGMTRDIARFSAATAELTGRVAPDLAASEPNTAVSELRRRLQQVREQAKQRALVADQHRAAVAAAETAARQLAACHAERDAVLALIGADDVEAAEARLALAAERARHAAALAEAAVKLREAGDLLPLADLRAEVAAVPPDDIPAGIAHAVQQRQDAQAAAQEAAAAASALRQQMKQAEDDTGARDAAADQQAAVATIGRVLEDALVQHLAAEMLDQALAAVEREGDTAVLRRISALFTRLTGGAYARVLTETDDLGPPRLTLLQRDYPDERQSVRELSEGTRDQLFLALRLAAIEEHAASAPPLPFLGDDILQTFDDSRALAAMQVLREVSETVQVILLTHHRHLVELAATLPDGIVHVCRIGAAAETAVG